MLAGVLTVLKIIGIILLVILALILFLTLLVLFVPVRYFADATVPETEFESFGDIKSYRLITGFSWLFHIVSAKIDFPDNKQFTVRIFGIQVFPKKQKEKDKDIEESADKDNEGDNDNGNEVSSEDEGSGEAAADIVDGNGAEPADEENAQDTSEAEADKSDDDTSVSVESSVEVSENSENNVDDEANSTDNSENKDEHKALIEILIDFFEKAQNILKTPQNVFEKTRYTISRVCDKINMIKTTLESDIYKRAFELTKKKLIRVMKMILPDKIKAKILFGNGDPADTAEIMAAYGTLYPVLYKKVSFEPDFERKVVMADVHAKGHLTVFVGLYCLAVCYFNKDVKKVIKRFKKIIKS